MIEGGIWPYAASLKALKSSPWGCFQHPSYGGYDVQVGVCVQVFTLAVIPAQSTEVKVLENNMVLDFWEDRTRQ